MSLSPASLSEPRIGPDLTGKVGIKQKPVPVRGGPAAFGPSNTVSTVSSLGFLPNDYTVAYATNPDTFFRYDLQVPEDNGAALTLPAGAVIDAIGLGSCDEGGGNVGVAVYVQSADG